MSKQLVVYMDGTCCGVVEQTDAGDLRFTYDDQYRRSPAATPLSLSMPLSITEHRKRSILPFLDGLITDNLAAGIALAARFGVSARSPFAMLTHMGADVAGALQILEPGQAATDHEASRGGYTLLSDTDVVGALSATVEEYQDGRSPGEYAGRFSLAGAQPKIALHQTPDGSWAVPLGATPTTHIFKPVAGEFRRMDVVEHMTMRAAALMGLNVAESNLTTFGSLRVFLTTRYDRVLVDGAWRRLHQEDLGQALKVPPQKKYQRDDGGPGVAEISQLFRGLTRRQDRVAMAAAFYQGLMFNTALECTDAHVKNYSVMLDGDSARLAPLYDLATFAPYKSPAKTTYSAMKIGKEYRFSAIGEKQCLESAALLRVDRGWALDVVRDIRHRAVGAFESARDEMADADGDTKTFANDVLTKVAALPSLRT